MRFVLIIPSYNEKENILQTISAVQEIFSQINGQDMNILITDGNSPDGTADLVKEVQKKSSNVYLLFETSKRGLGAAYTDAMIYAFDKLNADAIITFDADLSHDPKVIIKMVDLVSHGADYVVGTRYKKGGGIPEDWGIHRKIMSYGANLFARTIYFNNGLTDFTSGYKALTKSVFERVKDKIAHRYSGYTFAIASNLEIVRAGYKPVEIPYHFVDRKAGKSKMTSEYIFKAFAFLMKARIEDFIASRFGRVFIAGGVGAVSQLIAYRLFHSVIEISNIFNLSLSSLFLNIFEIHPRFLVSQLCAIEIGIIASFIVNNTWAFKDKRLTGIPLLKGFLKNHLVITGGILIQLVIGQVLASVFGVSLILNYVYQVLGILVGLIWNFYFYKKVVWKV